MRHVPNILAAAAILAFATPAIAHPKLVSATPAANATVKGKTPIRLTFSEKLTPRLSGATIALNGSKVADVTSAVAADGKSIELKPAKPLAAGSYRIDWFVVGGDTHRITGQHSFTVR